MIEMEPNPFEEMEWAKLIQLAVRQRTKYVYLTMLEAVGKQKERESGNFSQIRRYFGNTLRRHSTSTRAPHSTPKVRPLSYQ